MHFYVLDDCLREIDAKMVKNKISNTKSLDFHDYEKIVSTIKDAILTAQYEAAKGVNDIQLMLYFAIGRFVSLR